MDHLDLIRRIPPALFAERGLATSNFDEVRMDATLSQELIACLSSADDQDLTIGLRFAECLGDRQPFERLAGSSLGPIAALIRKLLSDQRVPVRRLATSAFSTFRDCYPDYSEAMLELFRSSDAQIRCEALSKAHTFLSGSFLTHLLVFREDPAVSEIDREHRYFLRDLALETAERITRRQFRCGTQSEVRDGMRVMWHRWTLFTHWLDRVQRRASEARS
jgi:hypothetical protein